MKYIDLLAKNYYADYEKKFNEMKHKIERLTDNNAKYNLKTGDIIIFKNGYNVPIKSKILGFENDNAYILWDCYWIPIDLNTRLIKKQ